MLETFITLGYLVAAILFIFGLAQMSKVRTSRQGNLLAGLGMLMAIVLTLAHIGIVDYRYILAGIVLGSVIGWITAVRVHMTQMPEMVALFNGSGGAASALVALATLWLHVIEEGRDETLDAVLGTSSALTVGLSVLIGAVTLSGSVVGYLKLKGSLKKGQPILLPGRHVINAILGLAALWLIVELGMVAVGQDTAIVALALAAVSVALGVLLVIPIGGADMPVVVCLLNSYSGMAASATGFVLNNNLLIISGALVGSSGLILTQIMCVAMNRSLLNVLAGALFRRCGGGCGIGRLMILSPRSTSLWGTGIVRWC